MFLHSAILSPVGPGLPPTEAGGLARYRQLHGWVPLIASCTSSYCTAHPPKGPGGAWPLGGKASGEGSGAIAVASELPMLAAITIAQAKALHRGPLALHLILFVVTPILFVGGTWAPLPIPPP